MWTSMVLATFGMYHERQETRLINRTPNWKAEWQVDNGHWN